MLCEVIYRNCNALYRMYCAGEAKRGCVLYGWCKERLRFVDVVYSAAKCCYVVVMHSQVECNYNFL